MLPVVVAPDARVLVRTAHLVNSDCLDLSDKILLLTGQTKRSLSSEGSNEGPATPTKRVRITQGIPIVATCVSDAAAALQPALVSVIANCSSIFPRKFVCEMASGMAALDDIANLADIQAEFRKVFPNTLFVKKTYYKHRLLYRQATCSGLIPEFVARGAANNGEWSALANYLRTMSGPFSQCKSAPGECISHDQFFDFLDTLSGGTLETSTSCSPSPPCPNINNDGISPFSIMAGRMEAFENNKYGEMAAVWAPDNDNLPLIVQDQPMALGSHKAIHQVCC